MKIIAYGSKYGTAKEYALELSKRTGIEALNHTDIEDINKYDTIIFLGALYAGSIVGMKKTLKKITDAKNKKIIIATVGLADPNDEENAGAIRAKIKSQLSDDICQNASLHFLRGAIYYSRLSRKHKTMMAFVYRRSKKLSEDETTAETRAIVETYGKDVSFVDFDALNEIIDEIR